jgi:hypothetical protein
MFPKLSLQLQLQMLQMLQMLARDAQDLELQSGARIT